VSKLPKLVDPPLPPGNPFAPKPAAPIVTVAPENPLEKKPTP
jgi:hypothetical protein